MIIRLSFSSTPSHEPTKSSDTPWIVGLPAVLHFVSRTLTIADLFLNVRIRLAC